MLLNFTADSSTVQACVSSEQWSGHSIPPYPERAPCTTAPINTFVRVLVDRLRKTTRGTPTRAKQTHGHHAGDPVWSHAPSIAAGAVRGGPAPLGNLAEALPAPAPVTPDLPDAPGAAQQAGQSTPQAAPEPDQLHLPKSFRPAWAVKRSTLLDKLSYGASSLVSIRNLTEAVIISNTPNLPSAPAQPPRAGPPGLNRCRQRLCAGHAGLWRCDG